MRLSHGLTAVSTGLKVSPGLRLYTDFLRFSFASGAWTEFRPSKPDFVTRV